MYSESRTETVSDRLIVQDATPGADETRNDTTSQANQSAPETDGASDRAAAAGGGLLLAGVALAAANMRPAVTSLSSILGGVRDSLGASTTWASVLTSVPTLCFGVAGIAAPLLARRWGMRRVVGIALGVLTAAMLFRVTGAATTVLVGTVVSCAAIAMCNVLIPVVVKESFPRRVGMATGLYTTAMAAGGSVGSAFTPWLRAELGGWRLALATWAVLALAAFLVWNSAGRGGDSGAGAAPKATAGAANGGASLLRSPLAWAVTVYFAMQSLVAYVVMGWLPEVFKSAGAGAGAAGGLLGLVLLIGVPISMVLPPLVTRTKGQSVWTVCLAATAISGFLGVLFAPMSAPLLWALLIGVGMSAFPLALVLISLRTSSAADTSRLSGMAQSIGYLIASTGPFLFGMLHDVTGSWSASLVVLIGVLTVQALVGTFAGRPRTV
ncbi:MFS transporter [Actinopolyspora erythraea]|uniref:MFS transporter n=2 Tax=Actinopolyspora TaxID=1849 RepID=A0A099D6J0_9ACTN|nr:MULTISPECIES: MFS transporter [Actinopolyspora]ASU78150.1 MFS transporter [Actinopolyspora erythraea]KGI81634.1 major facilitator transporter [Actinopolyspora erythraea]SDP46857.1 MFS transporter, CP family, cyanate transporter [Actinopolyspora xinjiangensis]